MPAAGNEQAGEVLTRLLAGAVAALALLALPEGAAATVTCDRTGDNVQVTATASGDQMTLRRQLGGGNPLLMNGSPCDDATINNVVTVTFNAQANNQTVTLDYGGGFLSTGQANRDYFVNGFGDTTLVTKGSPFSGTFVVAGADAIDADIGLGEPDIFPTGLGFFNAQGGNITEFMSTAGGNGTGGPYTGAALLEGNDGNDQLTAGATATTLEGGGGDDTLVANGGADADGGPDDDTITGGDGANELEGGDGRDRLSGLGGNDELTAGEGTDTLLGGAGDDAIDGGGGTDTASWEDVPGPVTASLASLGATGAGTDTLANVETLLGTAAGDTLSGGAGPETLLGADGDDTLVDGGGADAFDGGAGTDSLSYALAGGPVSADLGAGTASGGDALAGLERLVGSSFADSLFGTPAGDILAGGPGDDALDPRGGSDIVAGDAGADVLQLRDDAPDTGDCGDGSDRAVVDRSGDSVTACEAVELPPLPPAPCVPSFDIPANGIDENCNGRDARLRPVAATVASTWKRSARGATLTRLRTSSLPAGSRVRLRCKGADCPFKRKNVRGSGALNLFKAIGRRGAFPHGAVLTVQLRAPFALARTFTYRIRRNRIPRAKVRCAIAGSKRTRSC